VVVILEGTVQFEDADLVEFDLARGNGTFMPALRKNMRER
jgi:hypothetical protein